MHVEHSENPDPNLPANACALSLGRRLHGWRVERNLPLKALAIDLDVSVSTINAWEQGTRFPSGNHLVQISTYTDIPVCGLIWPGDGNCEFFKSRDACPLCEGDPGKDSPLRPENVE